MAKKPMMLCILDGFGWVPQETYGNAIAAAKTPYLDNLFATCPYVTIGASGMSVGLPDGQMGNSEVGHTNIGAGRIVYQQLTLITKSIQDGEMQKNDVLVRNMKAAIDAGKAIHFMGLMGTGGVHSHEEHLFGLLDMAKALGAKDVYIHAIMDGRDTDPHDGERFLQNVQDKLDEIGIGKIATVTGRYYAMDRDKNWDREEKAYAAFVYNEGERAAIAASISMRPYWRWLASMSEDALICGRNREAIDAAERLLASDPSDLSDVRFTLAYALAKLEDEKGLEELARRYETISALRPADDAWILLARCSLAHKRCDVAAARTLLVRLLGSYPGCGSLLITQGELPDGEFARLRVPPYGEDELILAVSEGAVLLQEGNERSGKGVFGAWVARTVAQLDPKAAAEAARRAGGEGARHS